MATGTLYRPPAGRDAYGDPVDADGNVVRLGEAGTIAGLVIGGPNWQPINGNVVNTTGLVGVPVVEAVQPEHGDQLLVDGVSYRIKGPPQWATRGGIVPTPPRYRWWTITAAAN